VEPTKRRTKDCLRLCAGRHHHTITVSVCRRDESRAMLTEIYGSFTESLGTSDLNDAKALPNEF
jgi:hypothetical protein